MKKVVSLIDAVISRPDDEKNLARVRKDVNTLMEKFPLY
jgi:glycine/serine hydroxymethyltransferase